jgi:hypothetical protein
MDINFNVGPLIASFSRSWMTGRAAVIVDGQHFKLQSPWNPATHFSLRLSKSWEVDIPDHKVVIEMVRPLFFPAFRPNAYRILVDDEVVAEKRGY